MAPSNPPPQNVNRLRPADVKIVAALGDSLSAGFGAGATTIDQVRTEYRGMTFESGGDLTLEHHVTIPNILRKYNPNLFGQSHGTGKSDKWEAAYLNAAVSGAVSGDLVTQAAQLKERMFAHRNQIDIHKDWKFINIFIGANDACAYCASNGHYMFSPMLYKNHIEDTLRFLYVNFKRVIVNIVSVLNMEVMTKVDKTNAFCKASHEMMCKCDTTTTINVTALILGYQKAVMDLQNSGAYEREDFTVIVQPAFTGIYDPPTLKDGTADVTFYAPDCYHFSQFGHAFVAKMIWNNMMEPVGRKSTNFDLNDPSMPLKCPDPKCPFIRTVRNSAWCN